MNRLIYDIEIIKAIPVGDLVDGIEYCDGWRDFDNMGVSVIGYKYNDEQSECDFFVSDFMELLLSIDDEDYRLVGFNSKSFDDNLLEANGFEGTKTHYDLLEEVRIAAGFKAHFRSVPKGYGYKLDAIAQANGMVKTGHGALAPVLWQQGKRQEVVDYCLNDVEITSKILDLGLAGNLVDPNTGKKLLLRPIA